MKQVQEIFRIPIFSQSLSQCSGKSKDAQCLQNETNEKTENDRLNY